jgi:ubiquinone/menaquinone biosynthesis C-methylase UbiE
MNTITELANKYASDKGTAIPNDGKHHGPRLNFTLMYDQYMSKYRNEPIKILEIGIGSGPSLNIWYEYFPNATIYAIDVDNHSQKNNDRVTTYICDQSNRNNLEELMKTIGEVDLIIDDGSHVIDHQQISLGFLFRYLKSGGQYWIEDLHTSDKSVWHGKTLYGYDMSFDDGESTVEVLESYDETKNFLSPFLTKEENDYLTQNISELKMFTLPITHWGINKLCLIEKK